MPLPRNFIPRQLYAWLQLVLGHWISLNVEEGLSENLNKKSSELMLQTAVYRYDLLSWYIFLGELFKRLHFQLTYLYQKGASKIYIYLLVHNSWPWHHTIFSSSRSLFFVFVCVCVYECACVCGLACVYVSKIVAVLLHWDRSTFETIQIRVKPIV